MSEEASSHIKEDKDIQHVLVPLEKAGKCETAVRPNQCQDSSNKDSDIGVDESISQEEEESENKNKIGHEALFVNDNYEDASREDIVDSGKNGKVVTDKFSNPRDNRPNSISPAAAVERVEILSENSSNGMLTKNCIQISSLNVGSDTEHSVPDQNSFSSFITNGIVLSEQNSQTDQEGEPFQPQKTMATSAQEQVGNDSPPKKKIKKESDNKLAGLENAEVVSNSLGNDMHTKISIPISSLKAVPRTRNAVSDRSSSSGSNDIVLSEQSSQTDQEGEPFQPQKTMATSAQEQVGPDSRPKKKIKKESDNNSAGLENAEVVSNSLGNDMLTKISIPISLLKAVPHTRNAVSDRSSSSGSNDIVLSEHSSIIAQGDVPLQPQETMATSVQEPVDTDCQPKKKETDKKPKKRELSYCITS